MQTSPQSRVWLIALLLAAVALPAMLRAHDVPNEIDIQAFVRPGGTGLQVLLRVPLLAITDTNLPKDGTGYLAMRYLDPALRDAAGQVASGVSFSENDERLARFEVVNARISLPSDQSFASYDTAVAHVRGPKLPDTTQLYYNQGYLDLELNYPIASVASDFGVQMLLGKGVANQTVTFVTYVAPNGRPHTFQLLNQTDVIHLDPSAFEAARVFLSTGFFAFIDGIEHLLFIVVLILPYRRVRDLMAPVASFGAAHTIMLLLAAAGLTPAGVWFQTAVGITVAFSIVYVAIENSLGVNLRRRWLVAALFGLVHGISFAFALRDSLQFAGGHGTAALLSFNLGLELGLAIILAIAAPLFTLLFTQTIPERAGVITVSVLAGHSAWHWAADGVAALQLMALPALDLALAATIVRWLLVVTIIATVVWFGRGLLQKKPDAVDLPEEKSIVNR